MNRKIVYPAAASLPLALIFAVYGLITNSMGETAAPTPAQTHAALMDFPEGTATPSETCGACHQTIYREVSEGFGSDLHWADMRNYSASDPVVVMLEGVARGSLDR